MVQIVNYELKYNYSDQHVLCRATFILRNTLITTWLNQFLVAPLTGHKWHSLCAEDLRTSRRFTSVNLRLIMFHSCKETL